MSKEEIDETKKQVELKTDGETEEESKQGKKKKDGLSEKKRNEKEDGQVSSVNSHKKTNKKEHFALPYSPFSGYTGNIKRQR